jgi:hypothetical protein
MSKKRSSQVNIGVIETTMLYQFANKSREQLISVSASFIFIHDMIYFDIFFINK